MDLLKLKRKSSLPYERRPPDEASIETIKSQGDSPKKKWWESSPLPSPGYWTFFLIAVLYTLLWGFVVMASKRSTDLSRRSEFSFQSGREEQETEHKAKLRSSQETRRTFLQTRFMLKGQINIFSGAGHRTQRQKSTPTRFLNQIFINLSQAQ